MSPAEPGAPATSAALSVGDVVADRYRIDAVLGEGGMGIVYRVEHLHLRKAHALKVLLPEWSSMPEIVARFEREAVAAGNIQSPHVAAATDFGRLPGGAFFLVMEFVNGRTLRAALEAGALDLARALHVLRGIVSALHAAHALGIVHRDMKPENIMLVARGADLDFVKVLDFGIAKVAEGAGAGRAGSGKALTQAGAVMGTPDYMSPEQALGQPVDARSDLYAVGVILFEMLTGRCPFGGGAVTVLRQHVMGEVPELPPAVIASVDPRIGAVLRRLLAKAPESRFASTEELMVALDEFSSDHGPPEPPRAARPSLESVHGMATPAAQRVRRSVMAGLGAIGGAVRGPFARHGNVRRATRGHLMVAAVVLAVLSTMVALLVAGSARHAPAPPTAPQATGSVGPRPATASGAPSSPPAGSDEAPSVTELPPPPAPSSSAGGTQQSGSSSGRSASPQGQPRRTGPGGIYIPPPSQWFR